MIERVSEWAREWREWCEWFERMNVASDQVACLKNAIVRVETNPSTSGLERKKWKKKAEREETAIFIQIIQIGRTDLKHR